MRSNKIDKAMHTLHASDDLYDRVVAESRERAERATDTGSPSPDGWPYAPSPWSQP